MDSFSIKKFMCDREKEHGNFKDRGNHSWTDYADHTDCSASGKEEKNKRGKISGN